MSPNRTPCPALTRARVEKRDVLRTARRKARIVSPHAQPPSARPRPAEAARALARPGFPQVLENGLGNEDASGLGRAVLSPTWATAPEPRGYFAAIGVPDAPRDVVVARKSRRKPLQRLKTELENGVGDPLSVRHGRDPRVPAALQRATRHEPFDRLEFPSQTPGKAQNGRGSGNTVEFDSAPAPQANRRRGGPPVFLPRVAQP